MRLLWVPAKVCRTFILDGAVVTFAIVVVVAVFLLFSSGIESFLSSSVYSIQSLKLSQTTLSQLHAVDCQKNKVKLN